MTLYFVRTIAVISLK